MGTCAQRFCDPACRQVAYRRRRANAPENTPVQRQGGRGRKLNPSPGPGGAKSAPSIRGQIRLTRPARSRIRSDSFIWTPGTCQGSRTHGADGWPSAAACRKGTCPETTTDPGETASASGTGSLRRHARQLDDDPFFIGQTRRAMMSRMRVLLTFAGGSGHLLPLRLLLTSLLHADTTWRSVARVRCSAHRKPPDSQAFDVAAAR